MIAVRLSDLSTLRQDFVRECQRMGFGKILRLVVRDGEPMFTEQTDVLIDLKLDAEESQRAEQSLSDFTLGAEILRLFSKLDAIGDGVIEQIEIRAGLPRRMVFKAPKRLRG
jgi:hypothetical protein